MYRLAMVLLACAAAAISAEPADDAVTVWAVPSIQKVRPDDSVEASNLVWSAKTKTVTIAGARNEHVPFQLVISTPPPATRHGRGASGFGVRASDLVSTSGRIPATRIKLYLEHVVLCYGKSSPVGGTGFWPDALVPLTDTFGMATEFRGFVKNRAVWVDVVVPPDAQSGRYAGTITVTQNGRVVDTLNIALRVHGFTLPGERHLITYIGIFGARLARFHGLNPGSPELKSLLRKYYDSLYANRMEPWFHDMLRPEIEELPGGDIRVRFDEREYDHYINALNTRRVVLESWAGELHRDEQFPAFSDGFKRRVVSYQSQVYEYFKKNGWLPRLVFNSPIDEPNTEQQYEETRRWAQLVHEAAPGVPFLVTESPVPDNPEWGTLVGFANNFAVHGNALNRPLVKKAIREEQAKGGEISWYISCDQKYPQPNYFIDAPAMDPVMVPWITWRYGMNGILYWDIGFWPQTPDPWLDPVTFLSGFLCSGGYVLNGEGCLLYPGDRARRYTGQANVDGPVSSLRLELLREGIEDYEYLWLLKTLGDAESADRFVGEMVVDVSTFSRNVEELFIQRQKMAERLESLMK